MKKTVTVDIEKIVYGGRGMGRAEGKVVFVPFTAPGDRVTVEIVRERKDYLEGGLDSIDVPSPLRIRPFCPVYGRCGGCQLQHLDYSRQVSMKEDNLREDLRRALKAASFEILPILPSAGDRAYRTRAQLKTAVAGKRTCLGFYGIRSHRAVEIRECPLLNPLANQILRELDGELREIGAEIPLMAAEILVSPDEAKGVVHLSGSGQGLVKFAAGFLRKSRFLKGIKLAGARNTFRGDLRLQFFLPGASPEERVRIQVQSGSFYQVNPHQNANLIRKIGEWAALSGGERVVDLFCGAGNLTLPLAQKAGRVWGIDADETAIAAAKENAALNGLKNCFFRADRAEKGALQVLEETGEIDLAVLDPPRAGAREVLDSLAALGPRKILYVSCEPPTLIRDLVRLAELGYRPIRLQPLDMFPQTYHLEVIAELRKEKPGRNR